MTSASRSDDLAVLTITEVAPLIEHRQVSPVEVVDAVLGRIEALDPTLHAFITLTAETARAEARVAESEIAHGNYRGPLHGIPIAHKDVFLTRGVRTTAHSRVLWEFVPSTDAAVVQRLKVAGAISLGKLNTYEFATGATSVIGASVNPWDTARSTGGSSGGSAAAVAAALCYAATGSDTGGSIRSPAAYCGIVGVKPTYGRVSRSGLIPFAWSLDHAGALARSARDAAIVLTALAGPDSRDPATDGAAPQDYLREYEDSARAVASLRIGVPDSSGLWGAHPEVVRIFDDSLKELERLVSGLARIEIPSAELMNAAYYGIRMPETTMIHQRWLRTSADKYDPFTRRKVLQGACLDACDYVEAQQFRRLLVAQVRALFTNNDLLAWPTTTRTSFLIEEPESPAGIGSELMNLTGYPSISIPCGFTREGLPVGMQITGRPRDEGRILALAGAFAHPSTIPTVTPTTKPQPARSYPVARLPEGTTDTQVDAARDEVRVALARNDFRVDEFDRELMAVTLCAHRAVQRAARAQSQDVEPLIHQLPS